MAMEKNNEKKKKNRKEDKIRRQRINTLFDNESEYIQFFPGDTMLGEYVIFNGIIFKKEALDQMLIYT